MRDANKKRWGPWTPWARPETPTDIGDKLFQAVYINGEGHVKNDSNGVNGSYRTMEGHIWAADDYPLAITLAYRVEQ